MIYVYMAIVIIIFILIPVTARKKRNEFTELNKKEHKLKILYPLSAGIYDLFGKAASKRENTRLNEMLRQMYVKENIEKEKYIYHIKKISLIIMIIFCMSLLGLLVCFSNRNSSVITTLSRNEPGQGAAEYSLEADYKGESHQVEIPVGEYKYTEKQIEEKLSGSVDGIKKEILNGNEALDKVSRPLNLISEYNGIKIFWEIEDTDYLSYNGEIKKEIKDGEKIEVNLLAELSFADVKETVLIPVVLVEKTLTENEMLVQSIKEEIEKQSSEFEKDVKLPEKINGKSIVFSKKITGNEETFLILAVLAIIVILIGYDKTLEKSIKKRQEQMVMDFSEIVSKLSLLYEAGLSIKMAWERICLDQEVKKEERFAYQEMKLTLEKIKNGMSEREAYREFGRRCGIHQYIKLGNILEQNLTKGTKGMKLLLKQEVEDSFESRKRLAKKKGEEASTRLLVPMIIMLVVVIIIIAVPALMSMNI